jgi:hypothetical protein
MAARGSKLCLAAGILFGLAVGQAAPTLTTIQDMLYNVDGTPFNGFLLIDSSSFQAPDLSNIAAQSLVSPIVDGVVLVQLVPNGTGSDYTVRYTSNGKIQFQETWVVPASTTPVTLSEVRSTPGSSSSGSGSGGGTTPPPADTEQVTEADVVNLVADLAARPEEGSGYAPSHAAYIDTSGMLEAVTGSTDNCVHVDGTSGPCGASGTGPGFVDGETPAGLVNGSNTVFTLANTPSPATSLAVYRNGLFQTQTVDYAIWGNSITFASGSTPQLGDILTASYRLADSGNPLGQAGGALAGQYPDPTLGLGVVVDDNVSATAGIEESKLALNYPTHSNANDPTSDEKAALSGTAGAPSASNPYVTAQDSRLSDARQPLGHALLGAAHTDTSAGTPVRGDVIVAQGTPALWARLPIGQANRCLMSNGTDAVWNTCLYTGFPAGSIPFVDANGNLAQSSLSLLWDNTNHKLSVGNNADSSTLYVWDAQISTGLTTLTVQAGQGQGTNPLQQWLDASANQLARVDPDGRVTGATFRGASSAARAAWQDAGSATDPGARTDGDAWFNTTSLARKTAEGGHVHATPQVLCSSTGAGTSSTVLVQLGTCTIPTGFLQPGDRAEIRFDYSHEGSGTGFTFAVLWGGTTLVSRAAAAGETALGGNADAGINTNGAQWRVESWGAVLALAASAGTAQDSLAAPLTVSFLGSMGGATSETVTLRNFTVIRYPAQQNP